MNSQRARKQNMCAVTKCTTNVNGHEKLSVTTCMKAMSETIQRFTKRSRWREVHSRQIIRLCIFDPRVNLALKLRLYFFEAFGLVLVQLTQRKDLLHAILPKDHLGRKIWQVGDVG